MHRIMTITLAAVLLTACAQAAALPSATPPIATDTPVVSTQTSTPLDDAPALETLAWDGASLDAVCILEANRDRPEHYGSTPEIKKVTLGADEACLILPSGDQPAPRMGEAALLVAIPAGPADQAHIKRYTAPAGELTAFAGQAAQPTPALTPTSAPCDFSISAGSPQSNVSNGVYFAEYPIARGDGCSPLDDPAAFYQRVQLTSAVGAIQSLEAGRASPERIEQLNDNLAPFGYKLKVYGENLVSIQKGSKVIRDNLSWIGQFTASKDGKRFILPGLDAYNAVSVLLSPDGIQTFDEANLLLYDRIYPVIAGNAEISLAYDTQAVERAPGNPALLRVFVGGKTVDTLALSGANPAGGPVRELWAWQDSWVIELPGVVVRDGELLNDSLGCSEMFAWRLIDGEPFYFCREEGRLRPYYAGKTLEPQYDEIIYTPQSGPGMLVQLRRYTEGLTFFARRGDRWIFTVVSPGMQD